MSHRPPARSPRAAVPPLLVVLLVLLGLTVGPLLAAAPGGASGASTGAPTAGERTVEEPSAPPALPAATDVDYQLGGVDEVPDHVGIVVRDRTEEPAGVYDVCYVNGFQTQPDARRFWRERWSLVLKDDRGRPVVDSAWGEWLLDLRTASKRERVARIVGRWIDGCARDGFEAVELDNLDSFLRSGGLLRRPQNLALASLLVERGHAAGLAVAQKNLAGYDGTRIGFDLAVAEECGRYDECDAYTEVFGDQVVVVEYRDRDFEATCAGFGDALPVVRRDRPLRPTYDPRWC
ncbi:endo alpha-1,4 polygalactosaminidase [Nocardioides sp. P86]|uniref:endo alpha-1,4 polygalactosaminidase n=1 Tax=Nocardioides sp. P86 TaxID=2939569 RepID=UPI002040C4D5|nr:endo alpha-1,4 polygalactosaminidase [Nocardioides sp. P86]MCM3515639.1 endo alpha-1,4 polygalactosaminidase [Nocardioides sp. P86]